MRFSQACRCCFKLLQGAATSAQRGERPLLSRASEAGIAVPRRSIAAVAPPLHGTHARSVGPCP
eukprot:11273573-Alexandrium_andersonii.AAC.1